MRIYVAGRTNERERVRQVQDECRAAGHTIAHDWTALGGSDADLSALQSARIAAEEAAAVSNSDLLILCWAPVMLGALLEVGMALRGGVPVWVLDATQPSVFWHLAGVRLLSVADLPLALRAN